MPTQREIDVQVTTTDGTPLAEWGITRKKSANLVTCYIESQNDMPFHITLKPRFPFWDPSYWPKSSDALRAPLLTGVPSSDIAPWHLLATLRLDGRASIEKEAFIFLDHAHGLFNTETKGMETMRHRYVTDKNGEIRRCTWAFKEIGIDVLFDKIDLSAADKGSSDAAVPSDQVDLHAELRAAFSQMELEDLAKNEQTTAGQIEITLEKILVQDTVEDEWRPYPTTGVGAESAPSDLSKVSHGVGRRDAGSVRSVDALYYDKLNEPEYAKFKFYYRSKDILRRYNFAGFAPSATQSDREGAVGGGQPAGAFTLAERKKRGVGDGEGGSAKGSKAARRYPSGAEEEDEQGETAEKVAEGDEEL